ncbi:MAG: ATP-binding cassette domain-containing protein, partial [Psychroflexus halocasei]
MIKVKNLHKSFDGTEVLKGINTSFEPGQTSLIIGQSGSGKTVFLKCLLGLHKPTKGDIYFNDKTYNDFTKTKKSLLRKNMGMVFQGGALFDS